jgi:hypothetical protein
MTPAYIPIDGMKRSPIVLEAVPNNGGGISYAITHKPSGKVMIEAACSDMNVVKRAAKRLWGKLGPEARAALASPTFGDHLPEYDAVLLATSEEMWKLHDEIGKLIEKKVRSERTAQPK